MWGNAISKEENYEKENAFAVSFIYNGDSKLFSRKTKSGASLNSIENKFNDLLEKEAQKKREFEVQKAQLETEVADLKAKEEGKEKLFEKLKKDSEVRWHRDKYKQILNNYDTYYKNLAKLIREKEQKISELEQILAIMGN